LPSWIIIGLAKKKDYVNLTSLKASFMIRIFIENIPKQYSASSSREKRRFSNNYDHLKVHMTFVLKGANHCIKAQTTQKSQGEKA